MEVFKMEEQPRDLKHLIEFIDYTRKNGYVASATASNRKRIVNTIFETVKNVDTTDVTTLDLDDLFERYTNLTASKVAFTSLPADKSHLKSAIREFSSYLADPARYRPRVRRVKGKPSETRPVKAEKHPPAITQPKEAVSPPSAEIADKAASVYTKQTKAFPSLHIDIQIHISPQASESQIDKVFESMAKHLKNLYDSTIAT